ncbi:chorismate lyase [Eikenella sp. S3360]|uniref:Chorismate lyase n=1 Tax=Eikenella glucosivorans TaxID=2766967 RepID=A0ABS0NB97_9NEIS|nr:chorismate lyase [Eikenella glucosivorans]MBH5329545.1 chorismate lyase [Eikenella glucosivorans]
MPPFPATLPPLAWQTAPPPAPETLRRLMQADSLTAALQATGADLRVQVAFQGEAVQLWPGEDLAGAAFHVRQVWLLLDGTPVVWARSVCRREAAEWQSILACGTRPLGKQLFGTGLAWQRSPLAFAAVPSAQQAQAAQAAWLRRSEFALHGETMVLTEGFTPELGRFLAAAD